jgi:hypothetical protein
LLPKEIDETWCCRTLDGRDGGGAAKTVDANLLTSSEVSAHTDI